MVKFREQVKAVAGAVVAFAMYVIATVQAGGTVIPSVSPFDKWGWLAFFGSMVLGYLGVYGAPTNRLPAAKLVAQVKEAGPFTQKAVVAAVHQATIVDQIGDSTDPPVG